MPFEDLQKNKACASFRLPQHTLDSVGRRRRTYVRPTCASAERPAVRIYTHVQHGTTQCETHTFSFFFYSNMDPDARAKVPVIIRLALHRRADRLSISKWGKKRQQRLRHVKEVRSTDKQQGRTHAQRDRARAKQLLPERTFEVPQATTCFFFFFVLSCTSVQHRSTMVDVAYPRQQ